MSLKPPLLQPLPGCLLAALLAATPALPLAAIAAAPSPAAAPAVNASGFDRRRYTPAILRLSFSGNRSAAGEPGQGSFLDLTLVPLSGEPIGRRVPVNTSAFAALLRSLYSQLSRQAPLEVDSPQAPARQLYQLLLRPLLPDLERLGVTTLLVAAEPGLQAVPLAALHDGSRYFGERYAFSLTPAIGLTPLALPTTPPAARSLAAGASRFEGLAPLPLVPQELARINQGSRVDRYLDRSFTPSVLVERLADPRVNRVHVATHAEFMPGGPSQARLFTGTEPFPLARFAQLRQRRSGAPLDLIVLSACRTALGDRDSELGFAGLALQAGARSAIGTLWYVDDVATSAFFVQYYRYLERGMPKAEALQATRLAMASGAIRLQGERVLGVDNQILLEDLSASQQQRVADGLRHPFFWAGITMLGVPW
jgi:CHAT domain-containing protein